MTDVFVSYAHEDRSRAEQLAAALTGQGWTVFWDRTVPAGGTWRTFVGKALSEARCVIVLWSVSSVESSWVQEEADDARQRGILVPVLFEDVLPPIGFRSVQAADLTQWDGGNGSEVFVRLLADIRRLPGFDTADPESDERPATQPVEAETDEKGDSSLAVSIPARGDRPETAEPSESPGSAEGVSREPSSSQGSAEERNAISRESAVVVGDTVETAPSQVPSSGEDAPTAPIPSYGPATSDGGTHVGRAAHPASTEELRSILRGRPGRVGTVAIAIAGLGIGLVQMLRGGSPRVGDLVVVPGLEASVRRVDAREVVLDEPTGLPPWLGDVGAYYPYRATVNTEIDPRYTIWLISPGFSPSSLRFGSLLEGRDITAEDRSSGSADVILLTREASRALYPGRSALGEVITVNGTPYTVVGVMEMPAETGVFALTARASLIRPLSDTTATTIGRLVAEPPSGTVLASPSFLKP